MKYPRPARVLALVLSFSALHLATADDAGAWRTNITAAIDCDGWTVTFENTEPDGDRYSMDVTLNETVTVAPGGSHTFHPISSPAVIVARWTDGRGGADRWTVTSPVLTGECHPDTTTTAAPPTTTTEQPTTVPPTSTTVQTPSTTAPPSTTEPPVQTCADLGYEITDLDGSCYDRLPSCLIAPATPGVPCPYDYEVPVMPDPVPVVATPTFTG